MPRPKSVVMDVHDPEELREHAARKAVQLAEPYRVYSATKRGVPKSQGWAVISVDSVGKRKMVMEGLDAQTADDLKSILEAAWILGRRSAMMD